LTIISIIVAFDKNQLIGRNNHLPWLIKEDFKFFKDTTMGHPVVMGKNTWLSIGKPLDGRINIILTRDVSFQINGCLTVNSIEQVFAEYPDQEVFIIGGSEVFRQFLPFAGKIYLTRIDYKFEGDVYFPYVNWKEWEIMSFEQKISESGYNLSFETWEKRDDKL